MEKIFKLGPSPHIRSGETVNNIMRDVIFALIPSIIAAIYFFRIKALMVITVSIIAAVITEALCQKIMKKEEGLFQKHN